MKSTVVSSGSGRWIGRGALGLGALTGVTAAGCWFLGWRNAIAFGDAMVVMGSLVTLMSSFGLFAALGDVARGQYALQNLPIPDALHERARNPRLDVPPSKALAITAVLCGLAAVAMGLVSMTAGGA